MTREGLCEAAHEITPVHEIRRGAGLIDGRKWSDAGRYRLRRAALPDRMSGQQRRNFVPAAQRGGGQRTPKRPRHTVDYNVKEQVIRTRIERNSQRTVSREGTVSV